MRLPLPICVETADVGKGQGFGIGHGLSMARQVGCLQCWISSAAIALWFAITAFGPIPRIFPVLRAK